MPSRRRHVGRLASLERQLAALDITDLPGQQLTAERGDGYFFTHPDAAAILTNAQRDDYERDGFVVIPGLLAGEAERYVARFEELIQLEKEEFPPGMQIVRDLVLVKEGVSSVSEKAITKLQHLETGAFLLSIFHRFYGNGDTFHFCCVAA